jgi:hypothetical protein
MTECIAAAAPEEKLSLPSDASASEIFNGLF